MRKITKITATAFMSVAILSSALHATEVGGKLSKKDISELRDSVPTLFKGPGVEIEEGVQRNGYKEVLVKRSTPRGDMYFEVFVVSGDGEEPTIIAGRAFDKEGKPVIMKNAIKDGVQIVIGEGNEDIYIVTDPECPYCRNLEKNMSKEALKNYKIHLITMPLQRHRNAKPMLYWVFAAKTPAEKAQRLHAVMTGDESYKLFKPTKEQKEKFDKMIAKSNSAAALLGAQGTPSVYDKNFKQIRDYSFLIKKPEAAK